MINGFAKPGDENPPERTHRGLSGRLGVWLLLGAVFAAFVAVTVIVLTTPLSRNDLGLLGGLKVEGNEDTLVYVGDRFIGHGTVEISWNDLLGASGRPALAVPGGEDANLSGEGATLIWSEAGPEGVFRGTQKADYSYRQELYTRADGQFDHVFVIACKFPDANSAETPWTELEIPIRVRQKGEAAKGYFPQPTVQGGGNISRGMIPSRRDSATFQLKLQTLDGVWPTGVEKPTETAVLWAPEGAEE